MVVFCTTRVGGLFRNITVVGWVNAKVVCGSCVKSRVDFGVWSRWQYKGGCVAYANNIVAVYRAAIPGTWCVVGQYQTTQQACRRKHSAVRRVADSTV
eukprot:1492709-Rhodomonas_salina.4